MEPPDLQTLLAERTALALSLGVTVDDEVYFLEDLMLEVQLLREEQKRRQHLACGPATPDASSAGANNVEALMHEARVAERAFADLEKQSPDGVVMSLGSSPPLRQRFAEARGALVRLLLLALERGAEQQLWKLHHRVVDAHQRAVRGLAAEAARRTGELRTGESNGHTWEVVCHDGAVPKD